MPKVKRQSNRLRAERKKEKDRQAKKNDVSGKQNQCDNVNKYLKDVKKGPTCTCVSCGCLWFDKSGSNTTYSFIQARNPSIDRTFIDCVCCDSARFNTEYCTSDDLIGWLCYVCRKYLLKGEIPPISLAHEELRFPEIPEELKILTQLEERFLAPRIGFIKIVSAFVDGQKSCRGRVVNVPCSVESSIDMLPRNYHNCGVIVVKLKKQASDKTNEMYSSVRVDVVKKAALILQNSEVYKQEGITLNLSNFDDIINSINAELSHEFNAENLSSNVDDCADQIGNDTTDRSNAEIAEFDDEDDNFANNDETCVLPDQGYVFAPGEYNQPLSLIRDAYCESMTFIKIYAGTIRKIPNHLTYQKWIQSEIKRADRRCCDIYRLFYAGNRLRILKMLQNTQFCLRRTRDEPRNITAGQLLDKSYVQKLMLKDYAYQVFEHDRGSPAFFEAKKRDVFAMVRQLGRPSIFLTLSSAETRWVELLIILKQTVDHEIVDSLYINNLGYPERCRLINSDPVTCARYFQHKLHCLFKLLKIPNGILGEHYVVDYYFRIEFQHRGSAHAHCLLWLNNAPQYVPGDELSRSQCVSFINKLITCENVKNSAVNYQLHKHSRTCKMKTKKGIICRFRVPWFPMDKTVILDPLPDDLDKSELDEIKSCYRKIKIQLNGMYQRRPKNLSFKQFLRNLDMTKECYYLAVRYTISKPTVFMKRNVNSIKVNSYNRAIIDLFQANMDMQFIIDVYSCARYVINYMSKSRRGLSFLLNSIVEEIKKGNLSLQDRLRQLSNAFLNASEFSAQEVVYYLLAMPISESSRASVFINTNPLDTRILVVKSKSYLERLDKSSNDVFITTRLQHYARRPKYLDHVCLADYTALYSRISTTKSNENVNDDVPELLSSEDEDDIFNDADSNVNRISVPGSRIGNYYVRKVCKIIRYISYRKEVDELNFCRENLMLFYPWRNEERDLINVNVIEKYNTHESVILYNKSKYVFSLRSHNTTEDDIEDIASRLDLDENDDNLNFPIVNDSHDRIVNEYEILDDRLLQGDILVDAGKAVPTGISDVDHTFSLPNLIDNNEYNKLMKSLNEKQRKYLLHILYCIRNNIDLPLYNIVLGSAGVGKSVLITALQQTLLRYYYHTPDSHPNQIQVLLCAPTGKAAYNIQGVTMHNAFKLPLNRHRGGLIPLTADVRNTLYAKLCDLKFILLDEISMCGAYMLNSVNLRLQQIFDNSLYFGGVSIIAFGDFNQLKPVGDYPIYKVILDDPLSVIAGNPLWELFNGYRLTEIMRQREDRTYAELLNHLVEGSLSNEEILMLQKRVSVSLPNHFVIHICKKNEDVDRYNDAILSNLDSITVTAVDQVLDETLSSAEKHILLNKFKSLHRTKASGLSYEVKICVGIRYIITYNIDVSDGLANGTDGILENIEYTADGSVRRVWLLIDDQRIGKEARALMYHYCMAHDIPTNLVPISYLKLSIRLPHSATAIIVRKQFPLKVAEARTIYGVQGSTFKEVAVHEAEKLNHMETYVSYSRVTTISGLYFVDSIFKVPRLVSDKYKFKITELETKRAVQFHLHYLQEYGNNESFIFLNVQSLHKYKNFIAADKCFLSATFMFFVETWTLPSDLYNFEEFSLIYRKDCAKRRHGYGVHLYCKQNILGKCNIIYEDNVYNKHYSRNIVAFTYNEYCFCIVYNKPDRKVKRLRKVLRKMLRQINLMLTSPVTKIIIVGDFNVDVSQQQNRKFLRFFENKSFTFKLADFISSTNSKTQIDLCFASYTNLECKYYENYWGHHKAITCLLNKSANQQEDVNTVDNSINISIADAPQMSSVNEKLSSTYLHNTKSANKTSVSKSKSFPVKGFSNLDGVSCYCNAIVQCLLNLQILIEQCNIVSNASVDTGNNDNFSREFSKILVQFTEVNDNARFLNSYPLRELVGYPYTLLNMQQDAAEFLGCLIAKCTFFKELSLNTLRITDKCSKCNFMKEHSEFENFLHVDVAQSGPSEIINLQEMLSKFEQPSIISSYKCSACQAANTTFRKHQIITCSPILFICLNIFYYNSATQQMEKAENLRIKDVHKGLLLNRKKYKLNSAVFHAGTTPMQGHYTAYLRSSRHALKCNDENVELCYAWPKFSRQAHTSRDDRQNSNAYILCYE